MHCLVYHVPFFTKNDGKLFSFSVQGVEKINDDIKKQTNGTQGRCLTSSKMDKTFDTENCERYKRNYIKGTNEYWSDIIFKQRAAKKAKISEDMSLVSDKYSENDPVPCSIDDLSVTAIRDELKKIRVKMRLKNRDKLLDLLKVNDNDSVVTFCVVEMYIFQIHLQFFFACSMLKQNRDLFYF